MNIKIINAQKFYLSNYLEPTPNEFELLSISTKTGVSTYKYIKVIYDQFFGREIGSILVGIRDGRIVSTIYNIIPNKGDIGVPKEIIDLIQKKLPFPFKEIKGTYGMIIDDEVISISRTKSLLTLNEDRIMFYNTIKQSLLEKTKK